jgi:hypothetical protein
MQGPAQYQIENANLRCAFRSGSWKGNLTHHDERWVPALFAGIVSLSPLCLHVLLDSGDTTTGCHIHRVLVRGQIFQFLAHRIVFELMTMTKGLVNFSRGSQRKDKKERLHCTMANMEGEN